MARILVERNIMGFRHGWIAIVTGFAEPVFYLFSLGVGLGGLIRLARLLSLAGVGLRSVALGGILVVVGALLTGCGRAAVRAFAALRPAPMRRPVVRLHAWAFQPRWEPGASILHNANRSAVRATLPPTTRRSWAGSANPNR